MFSKNIKIAILFFGFCLFLVLSNSALADCSGTSADGSGGEVCLDNPLGKDNPTPEILIGKVINGALGLVGSLALVMFIYGGFTWMLAAGNDQRVQKGKDILLWATIGLIVIFSSYAMVKFIFTGIGVTS